ncbi:hypothetical protein ACHAXT_004372 [Thalassiosira profunda]
MSPPSTSEGFAGDPYLAGVDPTALRGGCYERRQRVIEGTSEQPPFGLPLVAAWRSLPPSLESAYAALAKRVASCLQSTTGQADGGSCNSEPEAHIYPFEDLHVTVVTFRNSLDPVPADSKRKDAVKRFCIDVAEESTKREGWPKGKIVLRLRPKEIHLGTKNAFILWEEMSGAIEAMRPCLREEMEARKCAARGDGGIDPSTELSSFFVPTIAHSTFLRFYKRPSDPARLKELFGGSDLLDMLPGEVVVDANATLVYEDTPCMHIPPDDTHILWRAD